MFKNLRSVIGGAAAKDAKATEAADKKRRQKLKEREALAGLHGANGSLSGELGAKSLGSKRLARVMDRIKLIARTGRGKRIAQLKFDRHKQELEERKFKLMMLEQQQRQQQPARSANDDDDDDDDIDALSFYSALDHFAADEAIGVNAAPASAAADAAQDNFSGFLSDSKYILPEEQCDIPTFLATKNCARPLIEETRRLLRERHALKPESFYERDYERMLADDWTVTRFLLRRRLEPRRTAKLMEECGKFRKQFLMGEMQPWEFPREFHRAGGLFKYAPDRVGNQTLFMRVKMYRRVPEISDVFKAFILCQLEQCDVANGGRGTAVIFDLSACGLQNVDLAFLYWLLNSFRNYCPKGVSYILVYNLPWILSATCKLAMTWLSETNRRALRFVSGDEIETFIAREHLPDYLGGTCARDYKRAPAGSLPAIEVCERLDISRQQALKIKELFKEYLSDTDTDDDDDDGGDDDDYQESEHSEDNDHREPAGRRQLAVAGQGPASKLTSEAQGSSSSSARSSSSAAPSQASTALVSDLSRLRASHSPDGGRRPAAAAAPVVHLVSRASKFGATH